MSNPSHTARLNVPRGGLVDYAEAAELVDVKPSTVRWWVYKGWLEVFVNGPPKLFHTDDVYACERQRRHRATVPLQRFQPSDLTDTRPRVQHTD